jgi:hypothetical protein
VVWGEARLTQMIPKGLACQMVTPASAGSLIVKIADSGSHTPWTVWNVRHFALCITSLYIMCIHWNTIPQKLHVGWGNRSLSQSTVSLTVGGYRLTTRYYPP